MTPDYSHASAGPAIDPAKLLDRVLVALRKYVVFPSDSAAVAVALWIACTHCLPAFDHATRLCINSPAKRCGKSRLLDVVAALSHSALMSASATVAAIYRSLGGDQPPTLFLDEADTLWGSKRLAEQHEDLRALLNAGFQRGRPALRCVGPQQVPTAFPTFAMAALAGIGQMPDTITDRAVNIELRRRTVRETVAQYRERRDGPPLAALRDELAQWAAASVDNLAAAEPNLPVEDRAADTWEPLVAVADAAGGRWPAMARAACVELTASATAADEGPSGRAPLLADVRTVFAEGGNPPFMSSQNLVGGLRLLEESPWLEFDLTTRKLARDLKPYGVSSAHSDDKTSRGYRLYDLRDAFDRYLQPLPSQASDTSDSTDDQGKRSGRINPPDTSIRPEDSSRPEETTAQDTSGTRRTLGTVPAEKSGSRGRPGGPIPDGAPTCRYCSAPVGAEQVDPVSKRPAHLGCVISAQPGAPATLFSQEGALT